MSGPSNITRRDLLRGVAAAAVPALAGIGAAGASTAGGLAATAAAVGAGRSGLADPPRNVIFMVADGLSLGALSLLKPFAERARNGQGALWSGLLSDTTIAHGHLDMHSLNSLVTDSSAASSAWGSGSLIFNDAVNYLPDGTPLVPIAELVQRAGRRVGLVTTTTVTHATPAGFASCQKSRDDEREIAPQYLNRVDVVLGGGREFFVPELRPDRRDLVAEFRGAGYGVWTRRDDLLGGDRPARVLGVFGSGHLPFTIDRDRSDSLQSGVPTLAEMTRAALEILGTGEPGFLLQVEGGRVDHAAHSNDAAAMMWDLLAFDDALRVAREFALGGGDTLVVVTTDHGNANPGLNGMGSGYARSTESFERLLLARASYPVLFKEIAKGVLSGAAPPTDRVREVCRELLQIELRSEEARAVAASLGGLGTRPLNRQFREPVGVLGQVLSNHTGIGWSGTTHTADLAPLLAFGPGQDRFVGLRPATEVFESLTGFFGIRHVNPRLTPEAARKFSAAAGGRVHWV